MRVWQRRTGKTQGPSRATDPRTPRTEGRARALRCFDAWRDAAYDVEAAARRWRSAPADDWEVAAWAFSAALEREEKAAREYERAWQAWSLPRSLSPAGY
jgi:hypothetical protein